MIKIPNTITKTLANSLMPHRRLRKIYAYLPFLVTKPERVYIEMGWQCNLRCKQCDIWKTRKPSSVILTVDQKKKILLDLKRWIGPYWLAFTGGEPLIHFREVTTLIEYASSLGIHTSLNTNGRLISNDVASALISSGLKELHISLDGATPNTHDYLRGVKQTYDMAMKAIDYLTAIKKTMKSPLEIYFNSTPMMANIRELDRVVTIAQKKNLTGVYFQVFSSKTSFGGAPYKTNWWHNDPLWPTRNNVRSFMDKIFSLKSKGYPVLQSEAFLNDMKSYYDDPILWGQKAAPCKLGFNHIFIDTNGDVRLCLKFEPIGNLLKNLPEDIWYGTKSKKIREKIRLHLRECKLF